MAVENCSKCGRRLTTGAGAANDPHWNEMNGGVSCFPDCAKFIPTKRKDDTVASPKHYTQSPIECIDVLEQLDLPFHLANVIKYIWRHRDKNGIEDLRKARWYLDRYINREENRDATN